MAKVTMKKIAELAGVSIPTVSYVLNNRPGISLKTREKVLKIMEQENYLPKTGTPSLLHNSRNIYLVIDLISSFSNLFYSTILDTASVAAEKYDYNLIISHQTDSFMNSPAARAIRKGNVDGLIFFHDIDAEILIFLHQEHIPFVIVDAHRQDTNYPRICADYDLATYTATNYLIESGHERIGFISQRSLPEFYTATFNGFCRALTEHYLTIHPAWLQSDACDLPSTRECMKNILSFNMLPTAIVCATDFFALTAMHYAQEQGYRVPEDISFIGIDDLQVSQIHYPSLSTIHIDTFEMAFKAMEMLHKQIIGELSSDKQIEMLKSDKLITRNSVCTPKKQ